MAITLTELYSETSASSFGTRSFAVTTTEGTDVLLARMSGRFPPTGVRFNGKPLTSRRTQWSGNYANVSIWDLDSPDIGTYTFEWSYGATIDQFVQVDELKGVDFIPRGDSGDNFSFSKNRSVTLNTSPDDLVVDVHVIEGIFTSSVGPNQTVQFNDEISTGSSYTGRCNGSYEIATGPTTTMSWTSEVNSFSVIAAQVYKHMPRNRMRSRPKPVYSSPTDFKIQRGISYIYSGSYSSSLITSGVDYDPVSSESAFVRSVSHNYMGAGNIADFSGQPRQWTKTLSGSENIETGFNIRRHVARSDPTQSVSWEIMEYTGKSGGSNEFKVLHTETVLVDGGNESSSAIPITGVTKPANVVPFVTSQRYASDVGARADLSAALFYTVFDTGSNEVIVYRGYAETGGNSTDSEVTIAVVEFTGDNWNVQRFVHSASVEDTEETVSFPIPVQSTSSVFLHTQLYWIKGIGGTIHNHGMHLWPSDTGSLTSHTYGTHLAAVSGALVVYSIENTQKHGQTMNVTHYGRDTRNANTGTQPNDTWSSSLQSTVNPNTTFIMGESSQHNPGNTSDGHWATMAFSLSSSGQEAVFLRDAYYGKLDYIFSTVETPTEYRDRNIQIFKPYDSSNDFKIQRGTVIIPSGSDSASIYSGVDYDPVNSASAFVKVTSVGPWGSGNGALYTGLSYLSAGITNISNISASLQFRRAKSFDNITPQSAYSTASWQIIEYVGPEGGPNEFKVRHLQDIFWDRDSAPSSFEYSSSVVSGVVNDDDVVVFLSTVYNTQGTLMGAAEQLLDMTTEWSGSANRAWVICGNTLQFSRDSRIGISVVEFTGANWNIQRVTHSFSSNNEEIINLPTTLASTSSTFLYPQWSTADGGTSQVSDQIARFYIKTTGSLGAVTTGPRAAVGSGSGAIWIIENTQTVGDKMVVTHYSQSRAGGLSGEPDVWTSSLQSPVDLTTTSIMGESATVPGGAIGWGYHNIIMLGFELSSSGQEVTLMRPTDQYGVDYTFSTVKWPTAYRDTGIFTIK
jgi:hypothetical protein